MLMGDTDSIIVILMGHWQYYCNVDGDTDSIIVILMGHWQYYCNLNGALTVLL